MACCFRTLLTLVLLTLLPARAQTTPTPPCPSTTSALYARIRSVGLDPKRVYKIREAAIDRQSLHLDFDDGTLAFTEDVCGRITGAFFEGEGEIRLRPPNRTERASLSLFTGMAILDEQFTSAYLRFNDETAALLSRSLTPVSEGRDEFLQRWTDLTRPLAEFDAPRLLLDFSQLLPAPGAGPAAGFSPMLHAHLNGKTLGAFEVFYDAFRPEPIWIGQARLHDSILFFDIWTSFAPPAPPPASNTPVGGASITDFQIEASVEPPTRLKVSTDATVHVHNGGQRALLFELSRYLKVDSVEAAGRPLDFIQNPAMEGTQLQRRGNDQVIVVFPAPLKPGETLKLRFRYAGDVLSDAGNGLLYVGERGTWYPNFGLSPAQFDMEFHYPAAWTLVATGRQVSRSAVDPEGSNAVVTARWSSDRTIPVAGFNLGKYQRFEARAGSVLVEAYATRGVERSFPKAPPEVIEQPVFRGAPVPGARTPILVTPPPPSPARDAQTVADRGAAAVASFSQWFGPYPYSSLAFTQMPGNLSQGWPSLVFLSSLAFLGQHEQTDLNLDSVTRILDSEALVHEAAHQWWGDLVLWKTYRDQWIAEGLSNYASLLVLEQRNPSQFRQVLEKYRRDLAVSTKEGERLRDAGPVTLGLRLESSHFPGGYEAISYERGTWLFHMLRCMLRDAAARDARSHTGRSTAATIADEPFFRILRKVRDRYAGKAITTEELLHAFEEELPRPLWYEKRPKLDWFFQGWIEGTAIPELEARDVRFSDKSGASTVSGVIVQKDAPDDLVTAVPVYATTNTNAHIYLGQVLADGAETPFHFAVPPTARKIILDPRQTILTAPK